MYENSLKIPWGSEYPCDCLKKKLKKNTSINIDKEECKIMGNITMDSFVLDITKIKNKLLKEIIIITIN